MPYGLASQGERDQQKQVHIRVTFVAVALTYTHSSTDDLCTGWPMTGTRPRSARAPREGETNHGSLSSSVPVLCVATMAGPPMTCASGEQQPICICDLRRPTPFPHPPRYPPFFLCVELRTAHTTRTRLPRAAQNSTSHAGLVAAAVEAATAAWPSSDLSRGTLATSSLLIPSGAQGDRLLADQSRPSTSASVECQSDPA